MFGSSLNEVQEQTGEKRTHQMMLEQISTKLSSKDDWYKFLEQTPVEAHESSE